MNVASHSTLAYYIMKTCDMIRMTPMKIKYSKTFIKHYKDSFFLFSPPPLNHVFGNIL